VNNYRDGAASIYARPEKGMAKAFDHAASLGHHRIGYITGDLRFKKSSVASALLSSVHTHAPSSIPPPTATWSRRPRTGATCRPKSAIVAMTAGSRRCDGPWST